LLALALRQCIAAAPRTDLPDNQTDGAPLSELANRIEQGDYRAFSEAARRPRQTAVAFLNHYIQNVSKSSPQYKKAIEALKTVAGTEEYYQQQLAEAARKGGVDEDAFEMLSLIGSPKAAAAVAPYLFDFTTVPVGDGFSSTNALSATLALTQMGITDGPTERRESISDLDDIVAWQKWAIRNDLVPKEWNARVGLDEGLRRLQDISTGKVPIGSWKEAPKHSTVPIVSQATPIPSAPVSALPITPNPAIPAGKGDSSGWPWIIGSSVIALIALLFWKKSRLQDPR
jgi:hypothetical protein